MNMYPRCNRIRVWYLGSSQEFPTIIIHKSIIHYSVLHTRLDQMKAKQI